MSLEAIQWKDGKLDILDQLLLPEKHKYIPVVDAAGGWSVINKMQVRGAPAIAIVGCLSLSAELMSTDLTSFKDANDFGAFISKMLKYLVTARPTAVNMQKESTALDLFVKDGIGKGWQVETIKDKVVNWCVGMLEEDIVTNKKMGAYGCKSILDGLKMEKGSVKVLTHCNTGSLATAGYGTALGVVRSLHESKRLDHVFCTETRPYNQGARLTAYELVHDKLPATLICDSMAGALMDKRGIDAVIVGADRVAANGDTANKIGTYQLAVLAKFHNVPFYVCAPQSTIDLSLESGEFIPIEERNSKEMTHIGGKQIAATGILCWNPAFDVTPAELITGGIVTEIGVIPPSEIKEKVKL